MRDPDEGLLKIQQLAESVRTSQSSLAGFAAAIMRKAGPVQPQDVQDVLSEAFLAAAIRLRTDEALEVANMQGWFRRVLFLTCLNHAKRRKRYRETFFEEIRGEDQMLDLVASKKAPVELRIALDKAMRDHLNEKDRKIVQWAAEGLTSAEIATELGAGNEAAAVRKAKSRALERLRNALGGPEQWKE